MHLIDGTEKNHEGLLSGQLSPSTNMKQKAPEYKTRLLLGQTQLLAKFRTTQHKLDPV